MQKKNQKSKQRNFKAVFERVPFPSFIVLILASIHPVIVFSQVEEQGEKETQRQPVQIIEDIQILFNKILYEYKAQNYTGAEELATVTYLENYEYIEAPLGKKNKALMEETEIMLREDLRTAIGDKVPLQEVEQLINNINGNLDRAKQLFNDKSFT
jgi:high-affinity iron transporter